MAFNVDSSQCKLECPNISLVIDETLNMGSKTFKRTAASQTIPGFKLGEVVTDRFIEVPLPDYNPLGFKSKNLSEDEHINQLKAMRFQPSELVPSVSGRIVKAEYVMALELQYSGCLCGGYPGVSLPVQIYCPPIRVVQVVQAPPNWQPQMMPVINITLSPEYARNGNAGAFMEYQSGAKIQSNVGFMSPQPNMAMNVVQPLPQMNIQVQQPQMGMQMNTQQPLVQLTNMGGAQQVTQFNGGQMVGGQMGFQMNTNPMEIQMGGGQMGMQYNNQGQYGNQVGYQGQGQFQGQYGGQPVMVIQQGM